MHSARYIPLAGGYISDPDIDALGLGEEHRVASSRSATGAWAFVFAIVAAALAMLSSLYLFASLPTSVTGENLSPLVHRLRYPNPYPNLDLFHELQASKKSPKLIFPISIVRASEEFSDRLFSNDSHVFITKQNSMFFQWILHDRPFDMCYIAAAVPKPDALIHSSKSYVASGDVSTIEVWNVSYTGVLHHMSWDNRPHRIALLGTVNFTSVKGYDGWQLRAPTPRFDCPNGRYTVEVTCSSCRIDFQQVFSMPALGFDLQQLG